jgi:exosortase
MIWRNRERLAAATWKPSWVGGLLILPTMALLLLGKQANVTVIQSLSFIGLVIGCVLLLAGTAKTRVLLFPLLFLVTMVPLFPDQLINVVAFPIQMKSTQIAAALLNFISLHAVREGTMIQLDNYKMAVEGACSGFKTLVSLLTFSAAFAYLVEGATWKRWTVFLITAPLSLLLNGLRITFIGIVGELFGNKAAATFHDYSGFIVLIMAFFILYNLAALMKCDNFLGIPFNEEETKPGGEKTEEEKPSELALWWETVRGYRPSEESMRKVLPFAMIIMLALITTLGVQGAVVKKVEQLPPIGTSQVPLQLERNSVTWKADEKDRLLDKLTKDVQDQLNPTRVINRTYVGNDGGQIGMFMTAGNARWTFHDPHNCSLGSAAELQDVGVLDIPTSRGTLKVLECRWIPGKKQEPGLMMYFYVVPGRILQRTEQVHKALVLQTFLGDAGKPSYFLRFTYSTQGVTEEKRQQMIRFIAAMWESIGPVLECEKPAVAEPKPVPYKPG